MDIWTRNMSAFMRGEAARIAGDPLMVFDWNKAAKLIKDNKPFTASAGLAGDWDCTGGEIYRDGKPIPQDETYVYLASIWATPELEMDGLRQDCYIMEEDLPAEWEEDPAYIYWPKSALDILNDRP